MTIYEKLEKALSLLNSTENYADTLAKQHSDIDNKIQYWMHYLENEKITTKSSYRITRELKKLRQERREIKNDLEMLQSFKTSVSKLNNVDNRSLLMGQLRKVKNRQENWEYANNIYSEEEIEKILN